MHMRRLSEFVRNFALLSLTLAVPLQGKATSLAIDCGKWVSRTGTQKVQYEAYVVGLLNGMNNVWETTYFVREKNWVKSPLDRLGSAEQIFLYLDRHCRDKPLSDVLSGTYALWIEVSQKR